MFYQYPFINKGEYGANRIYAGQMAVLGKTSVGPIIQVENFLLFYYLI
jgi:hypothetical protein